MQKGETHRRENAAEIRAGRRPSEGLSRDLRGSESKSEESEHLERSRELGSRRRRRRESPFEVQLADFLRTPLLEFRAEANSEAAWV